MASQNTHQGHNGSPTPSSRLKAFSRPAADWVVAIGASTGGTDAILRVLRPLPEQCPPIVMTQHMPAGFTSSFVRRLDSLCAMNVKEAQDGELIQPGHAYLAPGGIA